MLRNKQCFSAYVLLPGVVSKKKKQNKTEKQKKYNGRPNHILDLHV